MQGEINNRIRAKQLRDYSSLRFGNITPTDIDGLIEYHGKGYVVLELKLRDAQIQYGQKLALERLTDDLQRAGKLTLCIIASHQCDNPEADIDVGSSIVTEYRFKRTWCIPKHEYSVKDLIMLFLERKELQ